MRIEEYIHEKGADLSKAYHRMRRENRTDQTLEQFMLEMYHVETLLLKKT